MKEDLAKEVSMLEKYIQSAPNSNSRAPRVSDLNPCPFCEEPATIFKENAGSGHGESYDRVGVRCTGCGVSFGESSYTNYEVEERLSRCMKKWSKRPNE